MKKLMAIIFVLAGAVAFTSCADTAAQDELQTKLKEGAKALTDTVSHYTNTVSEMQAKVDSLMELTKVD